MMVTLATEDGQFQSQAPSSEGDSDRVTLLTASERQLGALKTGSLWITATLLSVLIPVLHFFTVPLGLLLTGFFTYQSLKHTHAFRLDGLRCPKCQAELRENTVRTQGARLKVHCYSCRSGIDICPRV